MTTNEPAPTKSLAAALVAFQNDVPTIPKNRTAKIPTKAGSSYSYKYADLADMWEAIRKPLHTAGLAVTQMLSGGASGWTEIETTVWHESGQTLSKTVEVQTQGRSPQEVGAQITYFKRYALGAALGLSTEEDTDAAGLGGRSNELDEDPQLAAEVEAADEARAALLAKTEPYGWTADKLLARFWNDYKKNLRNTRDLNLIRSFGDVLVEEGKAAPARVQGTGQERVAPVRDEGPPPAPGPIPEPPITLHQMRKLHALFKDNAIGEDEQHDWLTDALGIPVESKKNLTTSEADRAIEKLEALKNAAPTDETR